MRISREIEARYQYCIEKSIWCVLTTVIKTEGSSYRKIGAKMLIDEHGALTGMIGGGCYDQEVARIAAKVHETQKPTIHKFDLTTDDPIFGYNTGCHGITWILFQPVTSNLEAVLTISKRSQDETVGIIYNGSRENFVSDAIRRSCDEVTSLLPEQTSECKNVYETTLREKRSNLQYVNENTTILWEYLPSLLHLIIVGCGADAIPLYELALAMGWKITLIDHREHFAKQEKLQNAHTIVGRADIILDQLAINQNTAIILMSHNYEIDKNSLKKLVNSDVRYIGLLGARNRCKRMLEEISTDQENTFNKDFLTKIFAPVGLGINGDNPETIALSIITEISYAIYGGNKNSKRLQSI